MELVIPEVVRDELMFQHCSSGKKLIEKIAEHTAEFSAITTVKHRHRMSEKALRKNVEEKFKRWLDGKDGKIADIPLATIDWRDLYRRAIWRIPPFALDAKNSDNEKGFRDALICETVVDLVLHEPREVNFAFVSNDKVLRIAVNEKLANQRRFLSFESLADFSSYIRLTREQLTKEFIDKIVKRAAEKFYTGGDENCLWNKENIPEKLIDIKEAWGIDQPLPPKLLGSSQTSPSLLGSPVANVTQPSPRWTLTAANFFYLGPHEFVKTSDARTYHWSSTVRSLRKYILSDGQVTMEERIQLIFFKIIWKADVKADARFHDMRLEEIKLYTQFLRLYRAQDWDQAELQLFNLQKQVPGSPLYSQTFVERISYLRANPPGKGWDGAFTFKTK